MCHLNILVKDKENNSQVVADFLNNVTAVSYYLNDDAEGLYFSKTDKLIKSDDKINLTLYNQDILTSNFILCHERISTSGKSKKYHQPFVYGDFVFLHNGIINEFVKKDASDTYGFMLKFIKNFNESKSKVREKNIVKAIQETLTDVYGSFSIALFDKKTEKLYYFKNSSTEIHFYKNKKYLYITTNDFNTNFFNILTKYKFKEMDIKDYTIYSIDNKRKILSIDKLKENERDYTTTKIYGNGYCGEYTGYPTRVTPFRNDYLNYFGDDNKFLTKDEQIALNTDMKRVENLTTGQRKILIQIREELYETEKEKKVINDWCEKSYLNNDERKQINELREYATENDILKAERVERAKEFMRNDWYDNEHEYY